MCNCGIAGLEEIGSMVEVSEIHITGPRKFLKSKFKFTRDSNGALMLV